MKKFKSPAIVLLFVLFSWALNAQKAPFKFGKVPMEQMQMTHYEADTSANAVVLGDFGITSFNYSDSKKDFQLEFERTRRIKILKKEGYEHANVEIYLYIKGSDKEKLTGLKAITHNLENGKIVETKLKDDGIFEEAYNDNTNILKFTFPNIKEGSVIEYNYRIVSDFTFNLQDWTFQSTVPTVISEYRVRIPEFFHYQQQVQGYLGLDNVERKTVQENFTIKYESLPQIGGSIERGQYTVPSLSKETRYIMENVPAFEVEGYTANPYNYLSKINFELATIKYPERPIIEIMGSWASLNKSFLESDGFGSQVNGSGYLKDDVTNVIASVSSDEQKIAKIYDYVKSNIEWNGYNSKFASMPFKKLLDKRTGSSGDINLLLVSMLKKAGINANPMLISTQHHGMVVEAFPISNQFNYVLCYVEIGDKYLLLDATDRSLPFNVLPTRCLNGRGFVISETNYGWRQITTPSSSSRMSANLVMDSVGNAMGTILASKTGYYANSARKQIWKSKEGYVLDTETKFGMEFNNSKFTGLDTIAEPFKEEHEVILENEVSGASLIYFNPILHGKFDKNPFKLEDRKYPVEFGYPFDELFYLNLQLPTNYEIDEMPGSKIILLPNNAGKFSYKVSTSGRNLIVVNQLTINKPIFSYDEYAALKEFFSTIVAKQAEQVVLKRSN